MKDQIDLNRHGTALSIRSLGRYDSFGEVVVLAEGVDHVEYMRRRRKRESADSWISALELGSFLLLGVTAMMTLLLGVGVAGDAVFDWGSGGGWNAVRNGLFSFWVAFPALLIISVLTFRVVLPAVRGRVRRAISTEDVVGSVYSDVAETVANRVTKGVRGRLASLGSSKGPEAVDFVLKSLSREVADRVEQEGEAASRRFAEEQEARMGALRDFVMRDPDGEGDPPSA